jgi:fatty acid desaturase
MSPHPPAASDAGEVRGRERLARTLGVSAALLIAILLTLTIRWPGPFVAVAVGYGVYRLAGGRAF